MAKSVNKVIIIGNLGKDPELKHTSSGTAVATIAVATNERFKDKAGEWQDRTEWHQVVLWQRLAEIAAEYLTKGKSVYIEGRLQTRSWEKDGEKRYTTEIVANDLVLLGGGARTPTEKEVFDSQTKGGGNATEITDDDIPF
jgi:single-strand DNA-binding protein